MERELKHVYQELFVHPSVRKTLGEEGVTTIASLLQAQPRLENDEIQVPTMFQQELCLAVRFIQEFQSDHGRAIEMRTDFNTNAFEKFKQSLPRVDIIPDLGCNYDSRSLSISTTEKELKHVYQELLVHPSVRKTLSEEGITTIALLFQARARLENDEIQAPTMFKQELCLAIRFIQDFQSEHGRAMEMRTDFKINAFEEFKKSLRLAEDTNPDTNLTEEPEAEVSAVGSSNNDDVSSLERKRRTENSLIDTFISWSQSRESILLLEIILQNENTLARLIKRECLNICKLMTQFLKGTLRMSAFDYKAFLQELITKALCRPYGSHGAPVVVAGKTQAGKSAIKGIVQAMCAHWNYVLIVITKGVSESRELHAKLKLFAAGTNAEKNIVSASATTKGGYGSWRQTQAEIQEVVEKGGTIVVADTCSQIKKAMKAIKAHRDGNLDKRRKFVVVVDECDAMFRTPNRAQKMEQAYDGLIDLGPCLTVMISATPVPLMIELMLNGTDQLADVSEDISLYQLEPTEEYMGIRETKALKRKDGGGPVYLEQTGLSHSKGFSLEKSEEEGQVNMFIPYTDEKVMLLYDDALSDGARKGILVLDCTCPRVMAAGNVTQKAERVQDFYRRKSNKDIVVVRNVGEGIFVKEPGKNWGPKQALQMGAVLEDIDKKLGLLTPIFVFAFTKMRRGISYRSSGRVPTHCAMLLGRGHNAMNVVQTMGRATFNGRSVLESNGFSHVTMLTTSNDYIMAHKVNDFVEEICRRKETGQSLREAMSGASEKMPDATNFLRHTSREIGPLKGQRNALRGRIAFEEHSAALSPDEENLRATYWDNAEAQRVFRVVFELAKKERRAFQADDIIDAYNDTFQDDGHTLRRKQLVTWLRKLCDSMVLQKEERSNSLRREAASYLVQNHKRLHQYMNEELAMTSGEIDEGFDLDQALGLRSEYDLSTGEVMVASNDSQSLVSSSPDAANPKRAQQVVSPIGQDLFLSSDIGLSASSGARYNDANNASANIISPKLPPSRKRKGR